MSSSSPPASVSSLSTVADAENPFDASAKADIILRSIDSVDFFVLKTILSLTSPVFGHMFSSATGDVKTKNGLSVVDLAEDSDTLYNLLLLVYPYAKEPTNTLDVYMKVGIVAQKYAMDEVLQRLHKLVGRREIIEKQSLSAFALAVHFDWVEMIKEAARNTLTIPLCDFRGGDELRMVTGADIVDLLQWRFACEQAKPLGQPSKRINKPTQSGRVRLERQRLKDTGCPQSEVLIKISEYREVLENAKSLAKEIDEEVAKVPFRIRGKWVVAPTVPSRTPTPVNEVDNAYVDRVIVWELLCGVQSPSHK